MPSILDNKDTDAPSIFLPALFLREARRQKGLAAVDVPAICILDPDGDIARRLRQTGQSKPFEHWPCYHTQLDIFTLAGQRLASVGCAVGAPFAVLIAEELFASGCQLLLSLTSAGQITPAGPTPYFVIIDRALRDEGTSYHYPPPSEYSDADPRLVAWPSKRSRRTTTVRHRRVNLDDRCALSRNRRGYRNAREPKACSPSKWKRLRSMPSQAR